MVTRFASSFLLASIGLFISGCNEPATSEGGDPRSRQVLESLSAGERQVVGGDNAFGFDLLAAQTTDSGPSNLFLSPLSLSIALTMAYNGARGETEIAMRTALGHAELANESVNGLYRKLLPALAAADSDVRFGMASSIWYQEGLEIVREFRELNRLSLRAEIREIDFQSPDAVSLINGWARENTEGLIKEIVQPPLSSGIRLILLNALHFKGNWSKPFDPKLTRMGIFRLEEGNEVSIAMMRAVRTFRWFEKDGVRGLELPYGDSLYSMVFVLPPEGEKFDAFVDGLNAEKWKGWMSAFVDRDGEVAMPKFRFSYEATLNAALQSLGMEKTFGPDADFSGIHPLGGLSISEVRQKTFVQVDEVGTQAAATSTVSMPDTAPKELIRLDRPFLFAIREKTSGVLPFLGWVKHPSY